LPDEVHHQAHALKVFNATAQKVVKHTISYAHIRANNTYYKEVLGQKMNKKLGSSRIYFTKEQYSQVKLLSIIFRRPPVANESYWALTSFGRP
jgi:hypothetical protein